jgi:hypothetical protein
MPKLNRMFKIGFFYSVVSLQMKRALCVLLLTSCSAMAHDLATKMRFAEEQNGERRYEGKVIVQGTFSIFEDGELSFMPYDSEQEIGFSNEGAALKLLDLQGATTKIDVEKICGVQGSANIEISGLTAGEGSGRPWQTTHLVRVLNRSRPSFLGCKANSAL